MAGKAPPSTTAGAASLGSSVDVGGIANSSPDSVIYTNHWSSPRM
jgi:hypothetical protein